jgi:DNA polymerase III subunit gamma/tau
MTYQVLARKWRPQDFEAVVGQEPVVTALRNGIAAGRIAQAYLFSGIRGVGKTSVARILAKALNCEKGPTPRPCNECSTCRDITAGSDLDVLEVDAATYSKVEQVRDLTESLKYGPARDRYKVVIIDEIHRLSRQAFDALLKIVEEPPPHLVFVFATTEAEAVPATILSRCQEFRFARVPGAALAQHLGEVAQAERIEVSEAALRLIARAADGSVRDAVALLDQLATYGSGAISDDEAARLLGGVDHQLFLRLLTAILAGDSAGVAGVVADVEAAGWDPRHVYTEFLGYARDALHLALGAESVDLPADEAARLRRLAQEAGYENLLRALHQLLASESTIRHTETGSLALEIAWLRAAELPKLTAIEEFLGRARSGGAAGGGGEPPQRNPAPPTKPPSRSAAPAARGEATRPVAAPDPEPEPAPESEPGQAPQAADEEPDEADPAPELPDPAAAAAPEPGPAPSDPPDVESFFLELSRRKQALAAHLREADRLVFAGGRLEIYAPPDDPWLNQERLQRPANRRVLDEAVAALWGAEARWRLLASEPRAGNEEEAAAPAAVDEVLSDPRVQTVLDIFGGSVESVIENEPVGD